MIGLSAPDIGAREEELVLEALRSGTLGLGPFLRRFERDFAAFAGTSHATAVSSGTAGLHLAVRLAGIGPGDEVITSPTSFVASANSILYERGTPVFADIDPGSFNIDPDAIEAAITPRTRAILPVHIFGYPCEIDRINEIAARHGLAVIEDAAEAVGSLAKGRRVGTHGNPAIFAFYPNKQITTGEGGMVTTDDADVQAGLQSLTNQGRADTGQWLEHDRLGYNYRLDELSAAVGVAQVERIDEILARRAAVAARYGELLADVAGDRPAEARRRWRRALVVRLRRAARPLVRPQRGDGAARPARRLEQAVPPDGAPAVVLPRARPPRGRVPGRRGGGDGARSRCRSTPSSIPRPGTRGGDPRGRARLALTRWARRSSRATCTSWRARSSAGC